MHILIDIGNSTVVVALADEQGNIANTWRFKTKKEETASFYRYELRQGLRKYGVEAADIQKITISSVVPEVNDDMAQAVSDLTGEQPHFFSIADAQGIITIDVESPAQLGKDRLADAIGAACCYGVPAIVIDFGTATTIGVIDENRVFRGGIIIPGVKTSMNALSARASQLPAITIEKPQNLIGRNTLECMQSGIVNGTAAMIDGLIDQLLPTFGGTTPHIIATGGMSRSIAQHCQHPITIDPHLLFKGLFLAK
jgi:type III pantothenate kinase